ncbi:MAG TPA: geranylgeranyl reductase family protein [Aggregatilineales bacterium]|nr:geranylgeranyl reductase family protein [Aggregatilineales bacterium]
MIYDAIVAGSGPGGAVAAATLAERGKSVLLVDRQGFPRDKVCGDGLPGNVMRMLDQQLGLDIRKAGLNHQQIFGISIQAPAGYSLVVDEHAQTWYSMVSPRLDFDYMLHRHAISKGAKFEVMDIAGPLLSREGDSGRVVGVIERKGKTTVEHEGRVVIAADGAGSSIARALRGRVSDPKETAIAIRAYARVKKPLPEKPIVYFKYLLTLVPGYAWVFAAGKDRVNIGIGLFDQGVYKKRGESLKHLLETFIAESSSDGFEVEPGSMKSWPIPCWISPESRAVQGAYLVGDAGRFVDALTGGGIYPAMVTGRLAAQSAVKFLDGMDRREAEALYDDGWRNGIAKDLNKARRVQALVASKPLVFNGIFGIAAMAPSLRGRLLQALAGQHN